MRFFKFAIGWPLSAVALFFVGKVILSNGKAVLLNLKEINPLLLLSGFLCFFLFYFIRVVTWKIILKEQGYNVSLKTASYLWELAELRRFVPGKFWSFMGRATLFSSINIPKRTTMKALIIETESFLLAGFIISFLGGVFYPNSFFANVSYTLLIPLIIILTIATILFINVSLFSRFTKGKFLSKITLLLPKFPPRKNILILFLSVFYLFLFGFGTYLTVTSITTLSPEFFIPLSALFVLSLLIGYISFLTPMGLGVRESVIIAGLSHFTSLSIAGFVSIFARIVLIISELIFLLFTYLWHRTKSQFVIDLEDFVASHKQEVIMAAPIIVYIVYFTTASFLRYDNFYTGRFDLGNMDQTVWNTIHGRIFELTDPNGTNIISRLAFHADFILILLAPFYLLWEDPRMLLLIQTIVLAVGSIFIYKIAENIIKNKKLSVTFAAAFLLNPAVQYTNLYDFHPVTLATTFLLGAFYFLRRNKYIWFLIFLLIAALTKEQVWIIVSLFGFYGFIANKHTPYRRSILTKRVLFLALFFISIFIFYFLVWHAIPAALGSKHFALSYYSDFGDSPTNIVRNFFTSPHKLLSTIFQKDQLSYIMQLFLPLGFLSLFSPILLIFSLPDLFINLLSKNSQLHQIYYQYSATITPFIFIAAIFGIKSLKKWFSKIPQTVYTLYLILATLFSGYLYGPLPFAKDPNIDMFTKPQQNRNRIEEFISNIPSKYSVASTNSAGSHLAHRRKVFNLPAGIDKADFIVFLLDNHFAQPSLSEQRKMVQETESDKNYVEVLRIDNFIVFKKRI